MSLGDEASSAGNVATVCGLAGLALTAAGVILLVVLKPSDPHRVSIAPFLAPGAGGVGAAARF